jgi:solute carrier family 30 (zinc transporter), member 5/7
VRLAPIALGVVISFASDAGYSINDVRATLPGYLALLLHILSTGVSEHFKYVLVPSVGSKYLSACCSVGAAILCLIVYSAREISVSTSRSSSAYSRPHARSFQMSVPPSPVVSFFSLCAIPLAAYSTQYGRSSFEAPVTTTPQYNLLSSASTFLATVTFGSMWFSRLPTTAEISMGIFLLYGLSPSL